MVIIDSMRDRHSRGELACSVPIEPSWPVFMACSRSKASGPRTSPTMMRSGRMRRQLRDEVAHRDLALAFEVRRPGLEPHHMRLLELQLGRVLAGDDALVELDVARQAVQQRRLAGAGAAGDHDVAAHLADDLEERRAPPARSRRTCTSWSRVSLSFLNLRIVSAGPSIASGGAMTLTREPSGRRASQIGDDSSTRRPTWLTIRWQMFISCWLSRKRTLVSWILPLTSM